ncbi:vanW family protein [Clostridium sp. CAG:354]|mgnify:FL=1|nr:VanW family protein [Clostridia bacterium]CDE11667.1 vanW family protein [Clostridium sp. CAG:354]
METTDLKIVENKENLKVGTVLGIVFISFIVIFFILFLGITLYISSSDKIITGIYIKGVEVAGLTKEQAIEKVTNEFNNVLPNNLTVVHGEYETQLNLEDLGTNLNIEEAVNRAYNIGRDSNIFKNMGTIIKNLVSINNLDLNVTVNTEQCTSILNDISTKLPDTVVQSSYYVEGNKLIITRGKSGNVVDVTPSIENIKNKIQDLTYASSKIELVTVAKEPDAIDIDKIHNEIYKEPVNAYYTTNPYVVYPHENGVDFNISVDEANAMLNEVKDEYEIPLKYTAPSVTTNMIGTEAFPDLLAKFSTNYNARDTDRTTNLRLAAEKINGTVLMPGETFSYNTVVGERTIAAGYKEAAMYQNGEVVDGLGGGICQISTTLYNAVLYSNLEIVERRNHQFVPSYASAGRDATVVYGSIDFRFKNTRNYPVKILCTVSGGVAKCEIYGLKENPDYDVEITSRVTQTTATSIKSETYKTVRQNGQVISSERINKDTYKRH